MLRYLTMQKYPILPTENQRLASLKSYNILDTAIESEFEELTRMASQICQTPVALITLLDDTRQWFKSAVGTNVKETPKEIAFCAHTIAEPRQLMVVNDLRKDKRFEGNPLVTGDPNVVFYAGVALNTAEGLPLGTLCVLDMEPKELNEHQLFCLEVLAKQVMTQMELKKKITALEQANESLLEVNTFVQKFASSAAHDLKTPLNNIHLSAQMLQLHLQNRGDEKGIRLADISLSSSENLIKIVDEMLEYSKDPSSLLSNFESLSLHDLLDKLQALIAIPENVKIELNEGSQNLITSKIALEQILLNLLTNAIRYSDKEKTLINIGLKETMSHYLFTVKDNGIGIQESQIDRIFDKHVTLGLKDRFNQQGSGIGLSSVKVLVEKLGGNIRVESEPGYGSVFMFSILKKPF